MYESRILARRAASDLALELDRRPQLLDVAVKALAVAPLGVLHEVGEGRGEGVDLLMEGLVVAALGVLKEGNEEEGEDRGQRVDHELPGVDASEDRDRRHPDDHREEADREEEAL